MRWTLAFSKRSKPPARRIDFFFSASTKRRFTSLKGLERPRNRNSSNLLRIFHPRTAGWLKRVRPDALGV